MKFDINKVICISLKSHNDQQLKAISEVYKLDFNALVTVKGTSPKIWVEAGGDYVIAFVNSVGDTTVNSIFCPITKREKDALLKITPIKTPKMPKATKAVDTKVDNTVEVSNVFIEDLIAEFDVVLDVDTILEKISATGMKSLTKAELDFLNSLSK
jgi:Trk K+ transport system NAD-binding subunit